MTTIDFRTAVREALDEELAHDDRVLFFGEDIAAAGGVFKVTEGLVDRFGPVRVFDTPISELAITGAAFGAAVTGSRPVIEIMFGDFMALAMDSLINQASKWRWVSNGQTTVPLVVRTTVGAGARFGPVHCQIPGTWLQNVPGLKVVCPSNANDAYGMLVAAIRDDDPVVFMEHKRLYLIESEVGRSRLDPIGQAAVARAGEDITIVSVMKGVADALAPPRCCRGRNRRRGHRPALPPAARRSDGHQSSSERTACSASRKDHAPADGPPALSAGRDRRARRARRRLRAVHARHTRSRLSAPLEDAALPGPERIAAEVAARLR